MSVFLLSQVWEWAVLHYLWYKSLPTQIESNNDSLPVAPFSLFLEGKSEQQFHEANVLHKDVFV